MSFPSLNLADRHKVFVDIAEHIDELIRDKSYDIKAPFNLLIPRGVFDNGIGVEREAYVHVPGMSPARGMSGWHVVKKAGEGTPPYDPCARDPEIVQHGYKAISYKLYQYSQATEAICISDITTNWQFELQARLMTNWLVKVTIQTWDQAFRDYYLQLAANANAFYVLTGGVPSHVVNYDMLAEDNDGDKTITFDRNVFESLSALDWRALQWLAIQKQYTAAGGAMTNETGQPLFGLMVNPYDLIESVLINADLRERFLYAQPDVLINGFGRGKSIPGYVVIEDLYAPRFVVKSITNTAVTLKMVWPFKQITHSGMIVGKDLVANPDYDTAPVGLGYVFVRNAFRADVRASDPTNVGGMVFGPMPGYNGQFRWINNPDMTANVRGDKGFFLADYAFAGNPGEYWDQPAAFLYLRCIGGPRVVCNLHPEGEEPGHKVLIASTTAYVHVPGTTNMADITLVKTLNAEVGADLTLTKDDNTTVDCVLVSDVKAPTYRIAFVEGTRPAEADVNDPAVAGITVDA